jgi:hypothetical protein
MFWNATLAPAQSFGTLRCCNLALSKFLQALPFALMLFKEIMRPSCEGCLQLALVPKFHFRSEFFMICLKLAATALGFGSGLFSRRRRHEARRCSPCVCGSNRKFGTERVNPISMDARRAHISYVRHAVARQRFSGRFFDDLYINAVIEVPPIDDLVSRDVFGNVDERHISSNGLNVLVNAQVAEVLLLDEAEGPMRGLANLDID